MIYTSFAKLYDQLFDEQMYLDWRRFVMQRVSQPHAQVLDLAGGAGRLAVLLAQRGYQMTVADLSNEMLSLADQHAQEARVSIQLAEANMLALDELDRYDAITCFADSFCYLANLVEVTQAFTQVRNHLTETGVFLFDVITPYQTDIVYPGYMYNYESEDQRTAFMWQSFGDPDASHAVVHGLTFFNQLPGQDTYERLTEEHCERTYELQEYLDALKTAGFDDVRVSAAFGDQEIDSKTTRWFFEVHVMP